MNNEDFVSYETAKKLKACGFDEPCRAHYTNDYVNDDPEDVSREVKFHYDWTSPYNYNRVVGNTSAPTLWHAQKWLRDEKKLSVEPYANIVAKFNYSIADLASFADKKGGGTGYDSYEAALSAGIDAALELILKG